MPRAGGGRLDAESETLIPTNGGVFDVASTLGAQLAKQSHSPAIAFKAGAGSKAGGVGASDEVSPTLGAAESGNNRTPAIAFNASQDPINGPIDCDGSTNGVLVPQMRVRRLMPVECERLMGFPDGYTAITYRGKPAADGPRYKALGNSWAINCVRWIGRRIDLAESVAQKVAA